nr:hypothetical protein [Tanacetum cinerariifolium]
MSRHTRASYVGTILTMVMIVHHGYRLSMNKNCATIKTLYTIDHQEDLNQQRMNDVDDRWSKMIESGNKIIQILGEIILQREQAANLSNHTLDPSRRFNFFDDDDDYEESTNTLNEIVSLELSTIPKKDSEEFIKSSVEDFVPIPIESENTSGSYSEYDLSSWGDFSPIDIQKGKFVTFSNPLFDSNDDFTSSDDYDVNLLFDEVLENIKTKDSYDPDLIVTPLFDTNEDECFDSGCDIDEIDAIDIPLDFEDDYYD